MQYGTVPSFRIPIDSRGTNDFNWAVLDTALFCSFRVADVRFWARGNYILNKLVPHGNLFYSGARGSNNRMGKSITR